MGMTIDEAVSWLLTITEHEGEDITIYDSDVEAIRIAIDTMRKYQKIQADYNARLKADMVAMLIELKNKLIDRSWNIDMYDDNLDFECCYLNDIDKLIQQKIDKYKAESEDKE